MDYISIAQAAEKWGVTRRWVQNLCNNGRIPGLERFGKSWAIPKDAVKPSDARLKSGKYVGWRKNALEADPAKPADKRAASGQTEQE